MADRSEEVARAEHGGTELSLRVCPPRLFRSAGLRFEHIEDGSVRSHLTLPFPSGGYGGAALSVSPRRGFAAALLHSGQGNVWYELFELTPKLRHIGGVDEMHVCCDHEPMAFSLDERVVAIAVCEELWWVDPDDEDPDWDTPSGGGMVEMGTLLVHRLGALSPSRHPLRVDLPRGWLPPDEMF